MEDSKSAECFVVHGAAKDFESEEVQLAKVTSYIKELYLSRYIKVGVKELNQFIEDRMFKHIKEKVPEMRHLLEDELHLCKVELDKIGREPVAPLTIAVRDSQSMAKNIIKAYSDFMPDYRRLVEHMDEDIYKIEMEPLGIVTVDEAKAELKRHNGYGRSISVIMEKEYNLILEVKQISEESRNLVNTPFIGKRKELEKWVHRFVEPFKKIITNFIEDLFRKFSCNIMQPSLEKGLSESTKLLMKIPKL